MTWLYGLASAAFIVLLAASFLSRKMMAGERLVGAYVGAAIIATVTGLVVLMLKAIGLI